jgi:mRNA-degrading endonuclease toxin of MazEF toxin-antitoxin module
MYEPPPPSESDRSALLSNSGPEQAGKRPYVVVSTETVHSGKLCVVAVPLTSRVHKANSFRIMLPKSVLVPHKGFNFTDSVALCDHVRPIDAERLREKIGSLSAAALVSVGLGLAYVFDIR